jgi:hypothetical protein
MSGWKPSCCTWSNVTHVVHHLCVSQRPFTLLVVRKGFVISDTGNWTRTGAKRPVVLWLSPQFVTSASRRTWKEGTESITTHRVLLFERLYQDRIKALRIPVVDLLAPTQSMWESTFDGMHFSKGEHRTQTGAMVAQIAFNVMFSALTSG